MARALTAWLRAPAPTTCTSTAPADRITPAMAPATEFGFDRLDTFRTSWSSPDESAVTLEGSTAIRPILFRFVRFTSRRPVPRPNGGLQDGEDGPAALGPEGGAQDGEVAVAGPGQLE